MHDAVMFKGSRDGIRLIINQSVEFGYILNQLKTKLDEAADFFTAGTTVKVPAALSFLNGEQREELAGLLAHYGLQCAECSETYAPEEELEVPEHVPAQLERHVQATITAKRLIASQLRIAGLIARAPDYLDISTYVETARIDNHHIIIEPATLGEE